MIETPRLVLRRPETHDARALPGFAGDAEVMSRLGDEPGGIEKAEELVGRWIALSGQEHNLATDHRPTR